MRVFEQAVGMAAPATLRIDGQRQHQPVAAMRLEFIEQMERDAIQQALQENRYNKTRTAAALGITFRALRYKLKKLGID